MASVAKSKAELGTFDIVLTNRPFGAKIPIKGAAVLSQYDLGYKWGRDKTTKKPTRSTTLEDKRRPKFCFSNAAFSS